MEQCLTSSFGVFSSLLLFVICNHGYLHCFNQERCESTRIESARRHLSYFNYVRTCHKPGQGKIMNLKDTASLQIMDFSWFLTTPTNLVIVLSIVWPQAEIFYYLLFIRNKNL